NTVCQYFNDKGLFVFDFIIICWKDRISETDMQILKSCEKWKIPTFLVRTNSQTQIQNLKLSEEITEEEATEKLKNETRETVKNNLKSGNYNDPNKKVYILDRHILGKIVSDFIHLYSITEDDIRTLVNAKVEGVIDESDFL